MNALSRYARHLGLTKSFYVSSRVNIRTMATPSKIKLSPSQHMTFAVPNLSQAAADKASELLQKNHDEHHIYFNDSGFHNHIVHHILTLFAIGATPAEMQRQYLTNASYQRPLNADRKLIDMSDPSNFDAHLGKESANTDYLFFFRKEMESKGWESVLDEFLLGGSKKADDMLCRFYAGFLHPVIHMGFGLEFVQPAIMAEALSQTATHDNWPGPFLLGAERLARDNATRQNGSGSGKPVQLLEILDLMQKDQKLVDSARDEDPNKIRDGIMKRAPDELIKYTAMYTVKPEELEMRIAELFNFTAYFSATAQPFPHKAVKFDFFYIHATNSTVLFPAFITSPQSSFIPIETKCRLLEWQARTCLALYVSRGSPPLNIKEITDYVPKPLTSEAKNGAAKAMNGNTNGNTNGVHGGEAEVWKNVFARVCKQDDDGHAAKLVRALAAGELACRDQKDAAGWKVKADMWPTIGQMAIDSVEGDVVHWVRNAGFENAWEGVEARPKRQRAEASL